MSTAAPYAEPLLEPFSLGHGFQNVETVADPGAATDAVFAIGRRFRVRPAVVRFHVAADANAGNRYPVVTFEDAAGAVLASSASAEALVANGAVDYSFNVGASPGGAVAAGVRVEPLPAVFLEPTRRIRVHVAGGKAGDAITAIRLTLEEFPTDPAEYRQGSRAGRRG